MLVCLFCGGPILAQTTAAPGPTEDPSISQQERICDREIDEVETAMAEHAESFDEMERARMITLLGEARRFCDDGNEVMAAIRLEAVAALIEITRPAE